MDVQPSSSVSLVMSEIALDCINLPLEDLALENVGGQCMFDVHDFERYHSTKHCDEKLMRISAALFDRINHYHEIPLPVPDVETTLSVSELFDLASPLCPSFSSDSDYLAYRLLHFLIVELQLLRLQRHSGGGLARRTRAAEKARVAFQLEKIAKALDISPTSLSEVGIIAEITDTVQKALISLPTGSMENSARIFSSTTLNPEQRTLFDRIAESFFADFSLRRRMLLKRLDVTIESFLWGEKAQGREGEIVAAIKGQRQRLVEEPARYVIQDVLEAPRSLVIEHSKPVTEKNVGVKSLVKTVIIGSVPDRGGRANEMRPRIEKPFLGRGHWRDKGGDASRGGERGGGGRCNDANDKSKDISRNRKPSDGKQHQQQQSDSSNKGSPGSEGQKSKKGRVVTLG